MIAEVYAALVAGDGRVATTCEPVAGGVRLRMPELPAIRDYNALVLAPGVDLAAVLELVARDQEVRRVIAFDPAGELALESWSRGTVTAMGLSRPGPFAWPDDVAEVDVDALRDARAEAEYFQGVPASEMEQLRALQDRQAEVARLVAVRRDGRPLAWAQVLAGIIDDVYVMPEARGQGLGRAVMAGALAAGGRWLVVDADNAPAVGLYESLGFVEAGTVVQLTRSG